MKLILTRITSHKTFQDAVGEAKNFVPMPREITKHEDEMKEGKVVRVTNYDPARKSDRFYTVQLVEKLPEPEVVVKEVVKEVIKEVEKPIDPIDLDDDGLKDLYKTVREELSKRKQAREAEEASKDEPAIKVSKARKEKGNK